MADWIAARARRCACAGRCETPDWCDAVFDSLPSRHVGNTSALCPQVGWRAAGWERTLQTPRTAFPFTCTRDWHAQTRVLLLFSKAAIFTWLCTILSTSAGCSGQSTFLTGGPTVGQLKTSLSHLEYENEQLKKRTAKLEQENRSMENRLVQEQINNGDLTARLDDARNLLRDRGVEPDVKLGSRRRGDDNDVSADDEPPPAQDPCRPAGQSGRAAKLRSPRYLRVRAMPHRKVMTTAAPHRRSRKSRDAKTDRSRRRNDDDLDHHSFQNGPLRWLPVADANDDSTIQIR